MREDSITKLIVEGVMATNYEEETWKKIIFFIPRVFEIIVIHFVYLFWRFIDWLYYDE